MKLEIPIVKKEVLFTPKCNMNCSYCYEPNKRFIELKIEDAKMLADDLCSLEFYLMGGEPFLNIDFISTLIDEIAKKDIDQMQKRRLIDSLRFVVTNGTLIKNNIDIVKKYGLRLSISLDGPEAINDKNRIYHNGKGTFRDIMDGIDTCIANNIEWSIHSTISINNLKNFFSLFMFYLNLATNIYSIDDAIEYMSSNMFQIITTENIFDSDINAFIEQQEKIMKYIITSSLDKSKKNRLAKGWFKKIKSSSCNAGNQLVAVDGIGDIYPCGELAATSEGTKYSNFKILDNYIAIKESRVFSSNFETLQENQKYYTLWCPSANLVSSGSVFYQNCKYNLMIDEYNRFIDEMFSYYGIK